MLIEPLENFYRDKALIEAKKKRNWQRASSIGHCPRRLGYEKLGVEGMPLTPRRMSIFDDGYFYDKKLKDDLVASSGGRIIPILANGFPSIVIEGVEIQRTPDFLILPLEYPTVGLGEIKSMNNRSFERTTNGEIDQGYLAQAWTYSQGNILNPIIFICVRKETRHICEVIFDRDATETVITKRYGGNELEIAAKDPALIAEVRTPFDGAVEQTIRDTIRSVSVVSALDDLPTGVRAIENETVKVQNREEKEQAKIAYGEAISQAGSWATFKTGRQIANFPCGYCGWVDRCLGAVLEIKKGKPLWVVPGKAD